jgi:hypothetical protein
MLQIGLDTIKDSAKMDAGEEKCRLIPKTCTDVSIGMEE